MHKVVNHGKRSLYIVYLIHFHCTLRKLLKTFFYPQNAIYNNLTLQHLFMVNFLS